MADSQRWLGRLAMPEQKPRASGALLRSSVLALSFQGKHSIRSQFGSKGRLVRDSIETGFLLVNG